jgi:hypothetical protein
MKQISLSSPARDRLRRSALIFAAWTVFGLYEAVQGRYQSAMWRKPLAWSSLFHSELSYAWLWFLLTPLAVGMARRFSLPSRRWPAYLLIHTVAALFCGALAKLAWDLVYPSYRRFFTGGVTLHKIGESIAAGIDVGFLLYWLVLITYWAYSYYRDLQTQVVAAAELRRQFADAQASALRMQLQPHFLFNTLNTITGLVHEDPNAAEAMIARLGDFLRHTIANRDSQLVPLGEEFRFIRLYLDIQTVRFEDRLTVRYDVAPNIEHVLVPSLILQPIVENAIRYAVSRRISEGFVSLSAYVEGDSLKLQVSDNGPGSSSDCQAKLPGTGVGLRNVRTRLETLYPGKSEMQYESNPAGGISVTLAIPYAPPNDAGASTGFNLRTKACAS